MEDLSGQEIRTVLAARSYEEAFEALLERFQGKVFRLCCCILANQALAEEASQEVFLRIWKSLAGFKGEASISTWVYSISRNTCLTILKREKGRQGAAPGEFPGQDASRRDNSDVRSAVARLPEKYRNVLLLFYYQEKSYEEVSAMLGLPLNTVKTHLHRAKRQLAEELHAMRRV